MAFRRGYRAELELVNLLRQQGFYCVRVPISGGRGLPCDVLAAKEKDRRAYEVKVTKKRVLYLNEKDVQELIEFSRNFGLEAYVAVRWKHARKNPWKFEQLHEPKSLKIYKEKPVHSEESRRSSRHLPHQKRIHSRKIRERHCKQGGKAKRDQRGSNSYERGG